MSKYLRLVEIARMIALMVDRGTWKMNDQSKGKSSDQEFAASANSQSIFWVIGLLAGLICLLSILLVAAVVGFGLTLKYHVGREVALRADNDLSNRQLPAIRSKLGGSVDWEQFKYDWKKLGQFKVDYQLEVDSILQKHVGFHGDTTFIVTNDPVSTYLSASEVRPGLAVIEYRAKLKTREKTIRENGKLVVDEFGQILYSDGKANVPLIGQKLASFGISRLPGEKSGWTSEETILYEKTTKTTEWVVANKSRDDEANSRNGLSSLAQRFKRAAPANAPPSRFKDMNRTLGPQNLLNRHPIDSTIGERFERFSPGYSVSPQLPTSNLRPRYLDEMLARTPFEQRYGDKPADRPVEKQTTKTIRETKVSMPFNVTETGQGKKLSNRQIDVNVITTLNPAVTAAKGMEVEIKSRYIFDAQFGLPRSVKADGTISMQSNDSVSFVFFDFQIDTERSTSSSELTDRVNPNKTKSDIGQHEVVDESELRAKEIARRISESRKKREQMRRERESWRGESQAKSPSSK